MRVEEFMDVYPVDSMVPRIDDAVYGAARRQGHLVGEATLSIIQGGITLNTAQKEAISVDKIADTNSDLTDLVNYGALDAEIEYSHFASACMHTYLRPQFEFLRQNSPEKIDFTFANISSMANLSVLGLRFMARYEKMRLTGVPVEEIVARPTFQLMGGIVNEMEVAIVLLGIARSQSPQRTLTVLPAPPQVEWYPAKARNKPNLHADILLVDTTDPDNRKVANVQVKSLVAGESAEDYDKDKVVLLCGQADLGNWTQSDEGTHTWPGRIVIQRAADLLLDPKNLRRSIAQGHIRQSQALRERSLNQSLLKSFKRRNINYKEIYQKIWPRLEKALDS